MKKMLLSILISLVIMAVPAFARNTAASDLLKGEFSLYSTFQGEGRSIPDLNTRFDLIFAEGDWDNEFFVELNYAGNLQHNDFNLDLGEAYYKYYGDNYDLGIGQQVISWGTAVEFNPTDNINPVESPELFTGKRPIPMFYGTYYLNNNYSISGVFVPFHQPVMTTVNIQENEFAAKKVAGDWQNSKYALKFSAKGIKGVDYSLSYLHGFEDLPTIGRLETPLGPQPDPTNIYFRKYDIIGADIASSYQGVGFWGEAAYFHPEEGEGYYSAVLGADYKFAGGYYLEGQIIYKKDQMLNENILLQGAVEKDLLTIHTFRTGMVYNPETKGIVLKPEINLSLTDEACLKVDYQFIDGEPLKTNMNILPPMKDSLGVELWYAF